MATLDINGTEFFIETIGDGPAVLLAHGGLGLDHSYLRPAFDRLADKHTVIYYDHRANGRSEGNPADLSLELLAEDMVSVLDALNIDQAILIGHSYGSFIGEVAALATPERFSKLVFASSVPALDYAPEPSGTDEQLAAFSSMFSGPMPDDDTWASTWSTVQPLYHHQFDADEASRIHAATNHSAAAWNAAAGLLATYNTVDQLPTISVPTLAISGAHDFITPPWPGTERIASLVPGATAVVLPASGHYPFNEQPDEFFAAVGDFLSS